MSEPASYERHLKLSIALATLKAALAQFDAARVMFAEVAKPETPGTVSDLEGAALGAAQDVSEMERRDRRTVELIRLELRRAIAGERRAESAPEPRPKRRLQVIDGERKSEVPLLSARFPIGGES